MDNISSDVAGILFISNCAYIFSLTSSNQYLTSFNLVIETVFVGMVVSTSSCGLYYRL